MAALIMDVQQLIRRCNHIYTDQDSTSKISGCWFTTQKID